MATPGAAAFQPDRELPLRGLVGRKVDRAEVLGRAEDAERQRPVTIGRYDLLAVPAEAVTGHPDLVHPGEDGGQGGQRPKVIGILMTEESDGVRLGLLVNDREPLLFKRGVLLHSDQPDGFAAAESAHERSLRLLASMPCVVPGPVAHLEDRRLLGQRAERRVQRRVHGGKVGLHVDERKVEGLRQPVESV